jgi:DNA-binding transcriptional ArsR family regulator
MDHHLFYLDRIYTMAIVHQPTQALSAPPVEVASGTGFDVLVALAHASGRPRDEVPAELREALDDVGDRVGELWLNLLGVPLDAGPPFSGERLASALSTIDPVELRRHVLGRYAWSWCTLAGVEAIEAAAAGDRAAFPRLLAHRRYYAGHGHDSLSTVLPLDPAEAGRRITRAVEVAVRHSTTSAATLETAATAARALLASTAPVDAIERVAGYRYVPEPEADRVLLVPHVQPGPRLVLAQHRATRLVLYSVGIDEAATEERVVALGRALADPKRIEILALLGGGVDRVSDLVEQSGLSRSTVHHHLGQLRKAGLIVLEGNARAYRYRPRREIVDEASSLLSALIGRRA